MRAALNPNRRFAVRCSDVRSNSSGGGSRTVRARTRSTRGPCGSAAAPCACRARRSPRRARPRASRATAPWRQPAVNRWPPSVANSPRTSQYVARHERADRLLARDQHRQRRRLHAADRVQRGVPRRSAARGDRARRVHADQPVGLGARARRVAERDRAAPPGRSAAKPRRIASSVSDEIHSRRTGGRAPANWTDVAKDQLALAPGIARVDDRGEPPVAAGAARTARSCSAACRDGRSRNSAGSIGSVSSRHAFQRAS